MADFISVIRRAVDGLSNNTPEMRAKVYDKARSAVTRQLENMTPRPPEEMLRRQLDKLEAAIQEVEAEHIEALPEDEGAAVLEEEFSLAPAADEYSGEERQAVVAESKAEEAPGTYTEEEQETAEAEEQPVSASYEPYEPEQAEGEESLSAEHEAEETAAAYAEEPAAPELRDWATEAEEHLAVEPSEPREHDEDKVILPVEETHGAGEEIAEVESFYRDTETSVAGGTVPVAETVPEYDRAFGDWVEPSETGGPEEEATGDHGRADQELAAAPAVPPATFEPWELPGEPTAGVEDEAEAAPAIAHKPELTGTRITGFEPWKTEDKSGSRDGTAIPADAASSMGDGLLEWDAADYQAPADVSGAKPGEAGSLDEFSDWYLEAAGPTAVAGAAAGKAAQADDKNQPEDKPSASDGAQQNIIDEFLAETEQKAYRIEPTQRRNYAPVVLGILGVALLAGGGYALWTNRDAMTTFVSGLFSSEPPSVAEQGTDKTTPAATDTGTQTGSPATPPAETAANGAAAPEDGAVTGQKFTQRLLPNGSEVDEGAGSAAADIAAGGEGKSVSEQTVAAADTPPGQATTPGAQSPTATPATPGTNATAVAAGQKAFLYEERLGQASPTAIPGSVEWTALRDTGEDGRPNPAIQGKLNVPDRGLTALITFKRNTDNSLPASHLIEVVFSVPPDFEGGAVDNVQRIAMKRTEQDRGDPLVAVAAKVTDDTYLIALNDFQDVVASNIELMRTRNWIDIPITYRNGRRALLTLDKGTEGAALFESVIKEWAALENGSGG
ncbi:MAG TPA: hypothetical protein DIC56_03845 [Rhizobium sp.]|nr:hypothetical protein [Rhizobium sp.]